MADPFSTQLLNAAKQVVPKPAPQPSPNVMPTVPAAPGAVNPATVAFDPKIGAATSAGYMQTPTRAPVQTSGPTATAPGNTDLRGVALSGLTDPGNAFGGPGPTFRDPGNNMVNPGYTEQAFNNLQNRLMEDPTADMKRQLFGETQNQLQGEQFLNQNQNTLMGPGEGDQYWNQVQGQFMDPFSGEQFTRDAAQNFAPTGAAGAFNQGAQGDYDHFTGYTGPQNTQGQLGASRGELAGGTQGEQGLGEIAGGYGDIGKYTDPNLAAGQYSQTQQAFGDLPIANFDPFYDRARQLATQDYNRQSAGRGVYGSSEALSGVGNVITDIEAQRANRSFDAEMQRAQEQRARQELLGNQARMGDLSSLGAFGANLSGAETFAGINKDLADTTLGRNRLLGDMANQADTQALGAQEANIRGLGTLGDIAGRAGTEETDRFRASNDAALGADRLGLDRLTAGADIAFEGDEQARKNFETSANAATSAANIGLDRQRLGRDIAGDLTDDDLARLEATFGGADLAEDDRQSRQKEAIKASAQQAEAIMNSVGSSLSNLIGLSDEDFERQWQSTILPMVQQGLLTGQQANDLKEALKYAGEETGAALKESKEASKPASSAPAPAPTTAPADNRRRPVRGPI